MAFGIPDWVLALLVLVIALVVIAAIVSALSEEGGLELAVEALELLD